MNPDFHWDGVVLKFLQPKKWVELNVQSRGRGRARITKAQFEISPFLLRWKTAFQDQWINSKAAAEKLNLSTRMIQLELKKPPLLLSLKNKAEMYSMLQWG